MWAREATGLNQSEFAELAGLKANQVWFLETTNPRLRRGVPTFPTLMKLASALGVSVEWLGDGKGARPKVADIAAAVKRGQRVAAREDQRG